MRTPPAQHATISARPVLTAELMTMSGLDERLLRLLVRRFYAAVRANCFAPNGSATETRIWHVRSPSGPRSPC